MEWTSATVLVVRPNDGRVLAMSRGNDLNNLGLPGGKRDAHDLTPYGTAMREMLEETGLSPLKNGGEVYAGRTVTGICRTFLVSQWGGTLQDMTREGLAIWVPPEMLLRRCSQYREYNARMFQAARAKSFL